MDLPDQRKIHTQPIPRLGGVSIFLVFNLVLLLASGIDFFFFPKNFLTSIDFVWLLLASSIVLGLGAVDDFRRMPPGVKFLFQIVAGVVVALSSYRIDTISLPFGNIQLGIWSIPVTVFWVVAITNAINLLDGLDGLAAGTAFIVCLTMFAVSILQQSVGTALASAILAGSILGFLKYNFNPASIFLGDSGAYFLGFELSVLSLHSSLKGTTAVTILVPIIALGLPIMDTLIAMLRRLLNSLHILEVNSEKGRGQVPLRERLEHVQSG